MMNKVKLDQPVLNPQWHNHETAQDHLSEIQKHYIKYFHNGENINYLE